MIRLCCGPWGGVASPARWVYRPPHDPASSRGHRMVRRVHPPRGHRRSMAADPVTVLTWAAAYLLGVVAVARAVRLVTSDNWPPTQLVRDWWKIRTAVRTPGGTVLYDDDGDPVPGPWTALLTCPFCFAPYPTAVAVAVAVAGGVWTPDLTTAAGWWWTLAVWASGAYLAAMVVVRDEPAPVDD